MNPMIPLFVAVPLAGAFLIMILGRLIIHFNKYVASLLPVDLIAFNTAISEPSVVGVSIFPGDDF